MRQFVGLFNVGNKETTAVWLSSAALARCR